VTSVLKVLGVHTFEMWNFFIHRQLVSRFFDALNGTCSQICLTINVTFHWIIFAMISQSWEVMEITDLQIWKVLKNSVKLVFKPWLEH